VRADIVVVLIGSIKLKNVNVGIAVSDQSYIRSAVSEGTSSSCPAELKR
jgi:hypothetical protein